MQTTLRVELRPAAPCSRARGRSSRSGRPTSGSGTTASTRRAAPSRAGRGDTGWIWRDGLAVRVDAMADDAGAFTAALLRGNTLAAALDAAGSDFAFDRWLLLALQQRWLVALHPTRPAGTA
jgi:hypothetical protein